MLRALKSSSRAIPTVQPRNQRIQSAVFYEFFPASCTYGDFYMLGVFKKTTVIKKACVSVNELKPHVFVACEQYKNLKILGISLRQSLKKFLPLLQPSLVGDPQRSKNRIRKSNRVNQSQGRP